jgi:ATP-dependent DNA helicase RecG
MESSIIPTTESGTVEFKTSFNEDVVETLVSFSNAKGGTVYVGVADNGVVKGIIIGKETIQNWINEVKNKTAPQIIPDIEIITIEEKQVAAISVIEYPVKPVSTRGRYYKRVANANHLMSIDEIANEHLKTINSSWDFYLDPNHSLNDISLEKVSRFIKNIEKQAQSDIDLPGLEFLEKLEILRNNQLTFGGYLLFVKDYCLISDVQVGRFKSDITIIDSISLNTDLFTEVDNIIAFIKKHLMVEYIITGEPQRTERFDYPLDAIREIVINMVVHRDYRDSSGSIIKIYDDRIEFYNPGKLYGGITIHDLFSGNYTSKSRNKLIARAFKEVGLIERYGSGIMRVRKICKEYGIKEPLLREISQGFEVVLYKNKYTDKSTDKYQEINTDKEINTDIDTDKYKEIVTDINTDKDTDNVTDNVTDKDIIKSTDKRNLSILELIRNNKFITTEEIAKVLGVVRRTIARDVEQLKSKSIIQRIGPDKGGYWVINN